MTSPPAGAMNELLARIADLERERDVLEGERDQALAERDRAVANWNQMTENAAGWMDEARHQAEERDRLAAAVARVRALAEHWCAVSPAEYATIEFGDAAAELRGTLDDA